MAKFSVFSDEAKRLGEILIAEGERGATATDQQGELAIYTRPSER